MRWIFVLLAFAGANAAAYATEVEFVRVWPQWHNADWFDRIGEYFGRPENDRPEIVTRTHSAERAGFYFLVRVKSGMPLAAARFVLEVIRPDSPDPRTFTFPVSFSSKGGVAELGLTGADWPSGRAAHPVAWKLSLVDAAGRTVASEQSFLWAKPDR